MADVGARLGEERELAVGEAGRHPVRRPRVRVAPAVQAVGEEDVAAEHPEVGDALDRRLAVRRQRPLELVARLREVHPVADAEVVGRGPRRPQQVVADGVLGVGEEEAVGARPELAALAAPHEVDPGLEARHPAALVLEARRPRVVDDRHRRAVVVAEVGAQAEPVGDLGVELGLPGLVLPALEHHRVDAGERRDAAPQQHRQHRLGAGPELLRREGGLGPLDEGAGAVARVARPVPEEEVDADVHEGVGVDEAGHDQPVAGVDDLVDLAPVGAADVEDPIAAEDDLAAVEEDVPAPLRVVADHRSAADADGAGLGAAHRSLGSRTSRSPSPKRFIAMTVTMIPSPGKTVSHHRP